MRLEITQVQSTLVFFNVGRAHGQIKWHGFFTIGEEEKYAHKIPQAATYAGEARSLQPPVPS
jgi:hypothetical protein